MVVIPHKELSPDALNGLLEEYASRDGTDYGAVERSLESKVSALLTQLEKKQVSIVFDPALEEFNLITKEDLADLLRQQTGPDGSGEVSGG